MCTGDEQVPRGGAQRDRQRGRAQGGDVGAQAVLTAPCFPSRVHRGATLSGLHTVTPSYASFYALTLTLL